MQLTYPLIASAGACLVAISPQTVAASRETAESLGLTFPLLSDSRNKVARRLGLVFRLRDDLQKIYRRGGYNLEEINGDDSWELPAPAAFVVDSDGFVTWRFVNPDYTRRPEPTELLSAIGIVA